MATEQVESESALVILVPEAEGLVAPFRLKYDPVTAMGVPAHITLLYPFMAPQLISIAEKSKLAEMSSKFHPFELKLTEVRLFPDVVYLHPEAGNNLTELIRALASAFPEFPLYEGRFAELIPHLTVAQVGDPSELEQLARRFRQKAKQFLPIIKQVTEVTLIEKRQNLWVPGDSFPFS